jgi:hypothetical protein
MAWSPVRRTNAGRFEVDHPGDYATFNSYHPSDATCRDRQVLSTLKAAAASTLKANVIVAHGKGADWSVYDANDIHLEAVSVSPNDEKASVFCSVTISAKGITERIVYVVSGTEGSWHVRFGGQSRSEMGGHALFPDGPITAEPTKRND